MARPGGRRRSLMNSRVPTIVLIAAMGVASLASGSAMAGTGAPAAALGRHAWHTAIEVPGTAALNQRGDAQITSVSCTSAGNCSAGGDDTDNCLPHHAFLD